MSDLISRQAAIDALSTITMYEGSIPFDTAVMRIEQLPSVQPNPKIERCKWIRYDYRTICPQNHDIDNPYWRIPEKRMEVLKYCPYCGKEIEVEE